MKLQYGLLFFAFAIGSKAFALNPLAYCLGDSLPLHPTSHSPYVKLEITSNAKTEKGWFVVDTGANYSYIDPKAWKLNPGCTDQSSVCKPQGFQFFSPYSSSRFYIQNYSYYSGEPLQAGLIGTDLLRAYSFTFDFTERRLYRGKSDGSFCTDETFASEKMVPLNTHGFYSHRNDRLNHMSDVWAFSADGSDYLIPNIPTVPIQMASVNAVAQIDTAYDDNQFPFSININQSFKDELDRSGTSLIAVPARNLSVSTCVDGVFEEIQAFKLPAGKTLTLMASDGAVARTYYHANIFLKKTPASAKVCGGVSTWGVPAAQMGVSFLKDAGTVVFDAKAEKVWIKKGESSR